MADPFHLPGLLQGWWRTANYQPFREGVDICPLNEGNPGVALLRYAPQAGVPRHLHTGLAMILVLEGTQSDERGDYPAGSLVLNPEGTAHSVWSDEGCVVLIQWERPVAFLPDAQD